MRKTGRGAAAPVLYSPECVESSFSEVRVAPVLCRVVCLASLYVEYTYMQ